MEESHKTYIDKKLAEALIHHHFADFGKSQYPQKISDGNLKYYRLGFFVTVLLAFLFQLLEPTVSIPYSLLGDIEIYTTTSALAAIYFSNKASGVKNSEKPTGPEIRNTRNALIWNSIAITINIVVLLMYFVFIPITKASDGTMTVEYF